MPPSSKPAVPCFADRAKLKGAVDEYISTCLYDKNCAVGQIYGWPINSWCVGDVTDMSYLFTGMDTFNEDISAWDTSSVTTMVSMFDGATSFNGNLSAWNTSSIITMDLMFYNATSFNGDLSSWNTKSVTSMKRMFKMVLHPSMVIYLQW